MYPILKLIKEIKSMRPWKLYKKKIKKKYEIQFSNNLILNDEIEKKN